MQGFIAQVLDQKSRATCTTAFKKVPNVRASAPSFLSIIDIRAHFSGALYKLPTTDRQSSPEAVKIQEVCNQLS